MEHGFLQQYSYDLWSLSELAWNGIITEAQLYLGVNSRIACVALTLCENLHQLPPVHTCTAVFTLPTTAAFLHDLPISLKRHERSCLPGIGSSDWEMRARPQMIRQSTDSWLPSSWKSLRGQNFHKNSRPSSKVLAHTEPLPYSASIRAVILCGGDLFSPQSMDTCAWNVSSDVAWTIFCLKGQKLTLSETVPSWVWL